MLKRNIYGAVVLALSIAFTGCVSGAKKFVKQGDRNAELGKFSVALEDYKKALAEKKVDSAYVVKQMAESYRKANKLDSARPYYKQLIDMGKGGDNYFYYAKALMLEGSYGAAKDNFNTYISQGNDPKLRDLATTKVENIDKIKEIAQKKTNYKVEGFKELNTANDDYGPLLYEAQLIFASNRGEQKTFEGDGQGYFDLYKYTFDGADESSGAISPFGEKINTPDAHEANATYMPDGKTMVFVRSNTGEKGDRAEVDLYYTRYRRGEWTDPELLPISDSATWDGCPSFSSDGRSLYFVSNRKGGQGGLDIWRAQLDRRGRIRKVANLGPEINTPGDEMFPYVSESGHLFFASDGHPGLGGLDLFRAEKQGREINIDNMGKPINSNYDDFAITLKNPIEGYFTSNRPGGKGRDDIYLFKEEDKKLKIANYFLDGQVKSTEGKPLAGVIVELRDTKGEVVEAGRTDSSGNFKMPVDAKRNYVVFLENGEDFFKKEVDFTTHGKSVPQEELEKDTTDVDLPFETRMKEIEIGETITLENVYYDYNSTDVQEESYQELEKVVNMMKDNPTLKIEIDAHTDLRGDAAYNKELSQGRAQSVVDYITEAGISEDRLIAVGKGEVEPIYPNAASEEEHQANRRTEFQVISK